MGVIAKKIRASELSFVAFKQSGSNELQYALVPEPVVPRPVQWAFLVFVFTIPFEAQDLGVMSGNLSPARIAGICFFAAYFCYHNSWFSQRHFPPMPTPVRWFWAYLGLYTAGNFISAVPDGGFVSRLITLLQLLVFLWTASALLKRSKFSTVVLLTFCAGMIILALGMTVGLFGLAKEITPGRTTVLKEDLNGLATNMGIAVITLMGLYFGSVFRSVASRVGASIAIIIPLIASVQTGSRGGLAAFMAGMLVFALPNRHLKSRFLPILIVGVVLLVIMAMVASNSEFLERWYQSYYDRDLSTREIMYPAAIEMFLQRPILGWAGETWHLEFRLGRWDDADPHNLFLSLLLQVGLVGTIPFVVGLGLIGRLAWKAKDGPLGLLPLALFVTVLVFSMTVTTLTSKTFWLMMAVALGAGEDVLRRQGKTIFFTGKPRKASSGEC
jgi:O-antigen ligase